MEQTEARQAARNLWAAGDYDGMVEHIWGVGADLVGRVGVEESERVLDVACGTGNATIPAAQAGADVIGLDLTPELLEGGRRRAAEADVEITWVEGDAEELPFDGARFDVVLSTFGCMFAPRHEVAAAEIARVLRPGGRLGIASWTPDGNIGRFFKMASSFGPPPPDGFKPPPLWGTREHVEQLFDGSDVELRFEDAAVDFRFESIEAEIELYESKFPPLVTLRAALEPEGRWEEVRQEMRAFNRRIDRGTDEGFSFDGEYLIALGTKSAAK